MRQSVPDEATCAICGRHFDPSESRGWCPNPSCGEWRHPSFPIEEEDDASSVAGSQASQGDSDRATKPCPHCGEVVREDARFCKHCVSPIDEEDEAAGGTEVEAEEVNSLIEECPDCGADLSGIPEERLSSCPICMFDLTPVVEGEAGGEQDPSAVDESTTGAPAEGQPVEEEPPAPTEEESAEQPPDESARAETPPPEESQEPDGQPPPAEPQADSSSAPPEDPGQAPPPGESSEGHQHGVEDTDPARVPQEHPPQDPDQPQRPPPEQGHHRESSPPPEQPPAGNQGSPHQSQGQPPGQAPPQEGQPPGQAPPQEGQPPAQPAAPTTCPNCEEDLTPIPPDMRTVCPGCRVDLEEGEAMSAQRDQDVEPDVDPTTTLDTMDEIAAGYLQRLSDAGIETIGELVRQDPDELAATTGVSSRRIRGWIEDAPLDPQDVENIPEPVAADDGDDVSETVIQPSGPGDLHLDVMGTELAIEDGDTVGKDVRSAMVDAGAPEEDAVYVHRKHVRFDINNNAWVLTRLGQNSLVVNGQEVGKGERVQITDGDEIDFSDVVKTQVDIR